MVFDAWHTGKFHIVSRTSRWRFRDVRSDGALQGKYGRPFDEAEPLNLLVGIVDNLTGHGTSASCDSAWWLRRSSRWLTQRQEFQRGRADALRRFLPFSMFRAAASYPLKNAKRIRPGASPLDPKDKEQKRKGQRVRSPGKHGTR